MFYAKPVVFYDRKHATNEPHFGIHHRLFDKDNGKVLFAGDTRYNLVAHRFILFVRHYHRACVVGLKGVADIDGNFLFHYGENGFRVQDRRAHIGKFAQFFISNLPYGFRFGNYSRIADQESADVRPVFVKVGVYTARDDRTRYIAAATAESLDIPFRIPAVKTWDNRLFYVF